MIREGERGGKGERERDRKTHTQRGERYRELKIEREREKEAAEQCGSCPSFFPAKEVRFLDPPPPEVRGKKGR